MAASLLDKAERSVQVVDLPEIFLALMFSTFKYLYPLVFAEPSQWI